MLRWGCCVNAYPGSLGTSAGEPLATVSRLWGSMLTNSVIDLSTTTKLKVNRDRDRMAGSRNCLLYHAINTILTGYGREAQLRNFGGFRDVSWPILAAAPTCWWMRETMAVIGCNPCTVSATVTQQSSAMRLHVRNDVHRAKKHRKCTGTGEISLGPRDVAVVAHPRARIIDCYAIHILAQRKILFYKENGSLRT